MSIQLGAYRVWQNKAVSLQIWPHAATAYSFTMEPGESSMACYQNAAAICIVIKLEPPLRLPPSFLLYLCSCLFLCIVFFSLDPISVIEIIPLLFSLPLETLLCSPFCASIFCFPCWLRHYHFGVVAHLLCIFFVSTGVFIALLMPLCHHEICDSMATTLICFCLWCSCLCMLQFEWAARSS